MLKPTPTPSPKQRFNPQFDESSKQGTPSTQRQFAALDLGSNSFHLLLVRPEGSGFVVIERLKEKVQLFSGFSDGKIREDAMQRGAACLARFAQRLRPIAAADTRVVGTCALRQAVNQSTFTARAKEILQCPVEVISGADEAALVYLGVAHHVPPTRARLVVDIGGGSTEFAFGSGYAAEHKESIDVGCVAFSDQYLSDHKVQSSGYRAARQRAIDHIGQSLAGGALMQAVQGDDPALTVFGTSGTIESIAMVLKANGWTDDAITQAGIAQLEQAIVTDRWLIDAGLPGLAPDRVDIFPAGVAILSACFATLGLTQMQFVDVSLMQGMVFEGLDSVEVANRREQSVAALGARFDLDSNQARRVAQCADQLYRQTTQWWQGDEECGRLLGWAAHLHELGVHIDARHYHRHGGYIVKHTHLAGFSQLQQSALALLVRGHRRSFPGLAFQAFGAELADRLIKLVALLRIAVILERSHDDRDSPSVTLELEQNHLRLVFQADWLQAHPLSQRELQVEVNQLQGAGLQLTVVDTNANDTTGLGRTP